MFDEPKNEDHEEDTFRMSVILFNGAKLAECDKVQRYLKRGWRIKEIGPVRVINKRTEGYSLLMKRHRKRRPQPRP